MRAHAQDYILEYFRLLTERRKKAHSQHLDRLTAHAYHYFHAPPHPNEIASAQAALKRGIDEDWQASVQRYPEVLEYFFSLVELTLPADEEPTVRDPPLSALSGSRKAARRGGGGGGAGSATIASGGFGQEREALPRGRTPPPNDRLDRISRGTPAPRARSFRPRRRRRRRPPPPTSPPTEQPIHADMSIRKPARPPHLPRRPIHFPFVMTRNAPCNEHYETTICMRASKTQTTLHSGEQSTFPRGRRREKSSAPLGMLFVFCFIFFVCSPPLAGFQRNGPDGRTGTSAVFSTLLFSTVRTESLGNIGIASPLQHDGLCQLCTWKKDQESQSDNSRRYHRLGIHHSQNTLCMYSVCACTFPASFSQAMPDALAAPRFSPDSFPIA